MQQNPFVPCTNFIGFLPPCRCILEVLRSGTDLAHAAHFGLHFIEASAKLRQLLSVLCSLTTDNAVKF